MNLSLVEHQLAGDGVAHLSCTKNNTPLQEATLIVLHYTAGISAESAARFLAHPAVKASAHVVIGRAGEVFQLVPFNVEAWHAGQSRYNGRGGVNRFSIGIELDNLGRLERHDGRFVAECGEEVPPAMVYTDEEGERPTFWHRYAHAQVQRLAEVCALLRANYPIRAMVGHAEITSRKVDPGPALAGEWGKTLGTIFP